MSDEDLLASLKATVFAQVAGDKVGRSGGDRGAQHQQLAFAQYRQQIVEHRLNLAQVDFDVGKRRRPERDNDRVGLGGVGDARRPLDLLSRRDARQHRFGARLVERHPARLNGVQALAVGVNADCSKALVGEGKRKRQAHAAAANNRYAEAHRPQVSCWWCGPWAQSCVALSGVQFGRGDSVVAAKAPFVAVE